MLEHLSRLEDKIDKITEKLASVDKTLAEQAVQIEEHVRRTSIAEENLNLLREDFEPVQRHVHHVEGALKLLGVLSVLSGLIAGLMKLLSL